MPITVLYLDHTAKWSGGEIALLRTLEAVDRQRVRPIVALAEEGPFAERLRAIDIETHILPLAAELREVRRAELGGGGLAGKLKTAVSYLLYSMKIAQASRRWNAQVLHCNSLKADIYGLVAGKLARVPVLWHVRDHIDPSYLPKNAVRAFRWLAKSQPAYVLTNSDSTLQKLFPDGYGRQRAKAVHDGLADRELMTPPPPERSTWKNQPPRICIVGRLVPWKGQHIFLDAATRLVQSGCEAEFVIIGAALFGEADYEEGLRKQAATLGGRVTFTGFQKDVPGLLQKLDICVHASTTPEPFGQVIIEAMAEGLPVIASDGGGVREIIRHGENGLLTPMGDPAALAEALRLLLSDPAKANQIARAGYNHVQQNFTAAQNARKIEAVYEEMLVKGVRRGR